MGGCMDPCLDQSAVDKLIIRTSHTYVLLKTRLPRGWSKSTTDRINCGIIQQTSSNDSSDNRLVLCRRKFHLCRYPHVFHAFDTVQQCGIKVQ